jgi:hypothetical protein
MSAARPIRDRNALRCEISFAVSPSSVVMKNGDVHFTISSVFDGLCRCSFVLADPTKAETYPEDTQHGGAVSANRWHFIS